VLEALVQAPKDVEDEDPVFNGCAEVSQIVGHGLELAAVLIDREVTLNKSTKDSIKVKSTLLTVTEKQVLNGEPEVARHATAFSDHLVKIRRDGVADPVEDDAVYPNPPCIIGWSVIHDVLDQGVALSSLLHEITPASVVGGGGVEDDVHQLADVEHCSRLKVKSGDDRVFVGRRSGGDELRGRDRGRQRRRRRRHALTGSCSCLLQGGGLGLHLEEEAGGLYAATCSGGLHLGILSLLDDGLEPSTEGSSLDVVRHGERTG
jgi:hypothetical protein